MDLEVRSQISKKEGAEALKPPAETAETLPQKVEGTKALRGWVPT